MNYRARLLLTLIPASVIPVVVLALLLRNEMDARFTKQYERRVEALVDVIRDDLSAQARSIAGALAAVRRAVAADNRLRGAIVSPAPTERPYVIDYAASVMQITGLSMLRIQDAEGRILSSGHFRNEFDAVEPVLPARLSSMSVGGRSAVLAVVRMPHAPLLALVRLDSVRIGTRYLSIVGGQVVERAMLRRLEREDAVRVSLVYPGGRLTSGDRLIVEAGAPAQEPAAFEDTVSDGMEQNPGTVEGGDPDDAIYREVEISYVDVATGEVGTAVYRVRHSLAELHELRAQLDRWVVGVALAAVLFTIALVFWLAARLTRPLTDLANRVARIDLDRLNVGFKTHRRDEIGALARVLSGMTRRIRSSRSALREAERRATMGDLARQVNHDIRNGLTPIRNVFKHLDELAIGAPQDLQTVFEERRGTLDSSISYLEHLAANYARISPRSVGTDLVLEEVVEDVVAEYSFSGKVRSNLRGGSVVYGNRLSVRRVLENLVRNGLDSLQGESESVTISTEAASEDGHRFIRLTVADTGSGMSDEVRERVFVDFYTTKETGTGLGMSIVRRLVTDLGGSIRVESQEGVGTTVIVDLPAVAEAGR